MEGVAQLYVRRIAVIWQEERGCMAGGAWLYNEERSYMMQ